MANKSKQLSKHKSEYDSTNGYWFDHWDGVFDHPPEGVVIQLRYSCRDRVFLGYFCQGKFYDLNHHRVYDIRYWREHHKRIMRNDTDASYEQYNLARQIIQAIIKGDQ